VECGVVATVGDLSAAIRGGAATPAGQGWVRGGVVGRVVTAGDFSGSNPGERAARKVIHPGHLSSESCWVGRLDASLENAEDGSGSSHQLGADAPRWTGGKQRLTATRLHAMLRAEGLVVGVTLG
jgi:hypothetical protein